MLIHIRKDRVEIRGATGTPMSNKFVEELFTALEYNGEGIFRVEEIPSIKTGYKNKTYIFKSKPDTLYNILYSISEKFDIELM